MGHTDIMVEASSNTNSFNDFKVAAQDYLQCGICLQSVCNPKMLACDHIFCKCCLDDVLQFDSYGNALINCPEGCMMRTFLSNTQTTNDLSVNCRAGCLGKVVAFCVSCDSFTCKFCCKVLHYQCQKTHPILSLSFGFEDGRQNNFTQICSRHKCKAVYYCCDGELICQYCLHREHNGHIYDTLCDSESESE